MREGLTVQDGNKEGAMKTVWGSVVLSVLRKSPWIWMILMAACHSSGGSGGGTGGGGY